ncbi:Zn(II)2Cys6 transcription factor [Aspergillus stella-maris]|uniref:Zn(II)2Cys6 transcription factor n=1 Tax=Aspergillus stella-maris TaxID=1810926 RepID=UPI003CCDCE95
MPAQPPKSQQPKRQKVFSKRSRTGCRTCRVRHVKCDETQPACRNCTTNGWKCEGYESNRLPREPKQHLQTAAPVATGFRWAMTTDEKRCVSFFLCRTVPGLTSYYDSSLWQKLVLQMCSTEPAVYHAVVALSAVNQDLERNGIPMPGTNTGSSWQRFALEQSIRSFGLLNRRHILQDPQLRQVLLVSCLLFVMLELALGHFDDATMHLQSGLAILKEMKIQRLTFGTASAMVEDSLLDAFLNLESQSAHHGVSVPRLGLDIQLLHSHYERYLHEFKTVQDVQHAFNPITNTTLPFLERCWSRPEDEIMAEYDMLHAQQQRLLSCLHQFNGYFTQFCETRYTRLDLKQQRGLDMIKCMYLTMAVAIKTCLYTRGCPEPASFMAEYKEMWSEAQSVIAKFEDRPLMTIETTICPTLFVVAARCPDYSIRLQALDALRSWPHCEGYLNSTLIADLVLEGIKGELKQLWRNSQANPRYLPPGLMFVENNGQQVVVHVGASKNAAGQMLSLEPNKKLADSLASIDTAQNWPCVRASGILMNRTLDSELYV